MHLIKIQVWFNTQSPKHHVQCYRQMHSQLLWKKIMMTRASNSYYQGISGLYQWQDVSQSYVQVKFKQEPPEYATYSTVKRKRAIAEDGLEHFPSPTHKCSRAHNTVNWSKTGQEPCPEYLLMLIMHIQFTCNVSTNVEVLCCEHDNRQITQLY